MNVAPLVLAQALKWRLPEQFRARFSQAQVPRTGFGSSLLNGLAVAPLPSEATAQFDAGFLHLPPNDWTKMLEAVPDNGVTDRNDASGVTGVRMLEPDMVVLFPDDLRPEPTFAFFAPTRISPRAVVLNTLRVTLSDYLTGRWKLSVNTVAGCTLKIEWTRKNTRVVSCANTGCDEPCGGPKKGSEYHRVDTLYCHC